MIAALLQVVAPVFGVALAGYLFAGFRRVDLESLGDLILLLAAPALVFSSLAEHEIGLERAALVGGGVIVESLVCGAVAWGVFRLARIRGRGLYLAVMFPNTGNLGLPLALFAFGSEGLAVAVVVFVAITVVHYSLGLMILSGKPHPGEALRAPLMHAAALGGVAAVLGIDLPEPVARWLKLLGDAAVPLMLIGLGVRMRSVRLGRLGLTLAVVALRMLPGFLAGLAWVWFFGLEGAERGVVLVTGVLPPAVMNFVLAESYGQQGEEVASAILVGTAVSILAIPAALTYAL